MKDWFIFLQYCEKEGLNPGIISFWRSFKNFSLRDKIAIILCIISFFLIIGFFIWDVYISHSTVYFTIPLAMLFVFLFVVIRTSKSDPYNLSEKRTRKQKEVLDLLKENAIKDKNQVKQLHNRLLNRLMNYDRNNANTMKKSTLLLTAFIFPLCLVFVSEIISRPISVNEMALYCVLVFYGCFFLYISAYGFFKLLCKVNSNRYNNLREFIKILRDILDFEFSIENEDVLEVHYFNP